LKATTLDELDAVLGALPASHIVAHRSGARLVVATIGCFVLVAVGDDLAASVRRSNALAHSTRCAIADHLPWVPFLDALAVGPRTDDGNGRVDSFVPLDLLKHLLTKGPDVVERAAVSCVRNLLATDRLDGWMSASGRADGTIDLCDPAPTLPAR